MKISDIPRALFVCAIVFNAVVAACWIAIAVVGRWPSLSMAYGWPPRGLGIVLGTAAAILMDVQLFLKYRRTGPAG
jgi:hypothetical protein